MPGPLAFPIAGWIAEAIAAATARAAASAATTAVLGGVATLPGDTPRENSEAKPTDRALTRTEEPCKKCPPDLGMKVRRRHGVNWNAYRYQARVSGFAYDAEYCQWSDEWNWEDTDFDGFVSAECLLQETKGNYDQFLDGSIRGSEDFFRGFDAMERQAIMQGTQVRAHPPTKLKWYFQTHLTHQRMAVLLAQLGALSETRP